MAIKVLGARKAGPVLTIMIREDWRAQKMVTNPLEPDLPWEVSLALAPHLASPRSSETAPLEFLSTLSCRLVARGLGSVS